MPSSQRPWWENNLSFFPSELGQVYGGGSVQQAIYNTLQKWLPTYLKEMDRHLGTGFIDIPLKWKQRPDNRSLGIGTQASILVEVHDTDGVPKEQREGTRSIWIARIGCHYFGTQSWEETQYTALAYAAAIRLCIAQQQSLGGLAETCKWQAENYRELEHTATRSIGYAITTFQVTLPNTMEIFKNPPREPWVPEGATSLPSLLPYPESPTVEEANVTIDNEEV